MLIVAVFHFFNACVMMLQHFYAVRAVIRYSSVDAVRAHPSLAVHLLLSDILVVHPPITYVISLVRCNPLKYN